MGDLVTFKARFLGFKMMVNMPGKTRRSIAVHAIKISKYIDFLCSFGQLCRLNG